MTSFWFQAARGRAMVRNRAIRKARALTAKLANPNYGLWQYERDELRAEINRQVRRARQANRDWREYRRLHAELEAIGR